MFVERATGRLCTLYLQAEESHRHPVYFCEPLSTHDIRLRLRIVSPLRNVTHPLTDGYCSVPVSADNTDGPFPSARLDIRDTQPIWAFCRQANHCQQGMVFAVNPGDKFAAFKAAAMAGSSPPASTPPAVTSTPPPSTSTSTPPPTPTGTDHRVVVGGPGVLAFNPTTVVAQPGDTVTFEFHQKNHTATQSTFADPCKPMSGGFNSGL